MRRPLAFGVGIPKFMVKPILHCLPGFLGKASDWSSFSQNTFDSCPYDFMRPEALGKTLEERAHLLNADRSKEGGVLLGYSLGGRIALHALTQSPESWRGAIIVSANPGLRDTSERDVRVEVDRKWARRFLEESWSSVLRDWDAQPVFGSQPYPLQDEGVDPRSELSRELCADLLTSCSLGLQEDLRPKIARLKVPILWISGEQDVKYSQIGEEMVRLNSGIRHLSIPGAGHRVNPEKVGAHLFALEEYVNVDQN
jgi:2-succinyl-6-hydroxy-2,4-cyclohexadiene-1-carboxylate synthase